MECLAAAKMELNRSQVVKDQPVTVKQGWAKDTLDWLSKRVGRRWIGSQEIKARQPHDRMLIHSQKLASYIKGYLFINTEFHSEEDHATSAPKNWFRLPLVWDIITLSECVQSTMCDVFGFKYPIHLASHHGQLVPRN